MAEFGGNGGFDLRFVLGAVAVDLTVEIAKFGGGVDKKTAAKWA